MDIKPDISCLRSSVKTLGFLFFCCLLVTESQGATGEVFVTSPVVDDINMIVVPVDQVSLAVSGTYILTENATPNFKGPTEYCDGGIGTLKPRYWEGGETAGAPVGYYAELYSSVDWGPRRNIGSVRYGHGYNPGTEYDRLNTLLNFSFSISLKNLQKDAPHEILIELIDIFSLYCQPAYWWYLGSAQKRYGEVITSFSLPFFLGEPTPAEENQAPDPDPGGCNSNRNLVALD
ncbi:MAG: hypothetical protein AB1461_04110 [Thermodesulfobacteriota bacterium]